MKQNLNFVFFFWIISFPIFSQTFDCEEELFSKKNRKTRLFGYVNAIGEFRIPPRFLTAKPFVGKHAIVQEGKSFGIVNCEGVLVLPAEFEAIASFSNGKGWVKKMGLWGLADVKGRMLIQPSFEDVKEVNTFNGNVTWVKKAGLWGLVSKENGRFLVQNQYDDISSISDSAGIGRKAGNQDLVYYGDGRVIISGMRQVSRISTNIFLYQSAEGKFGTFNPLAYILLRPVWDGIEYNLPLLKVKRDNVFGLLSVRGETVLEPQFDEIQNFIGGFAIVRKGRNFKVVSTKGEYVSPEGEYSFAEIGKSATSIFSNREKSGIWDLKNKKWLNPLEVQSCKFGQSKKWIEMLNPGLSRIFLVEKGVFKDVSFDSLSTIDSDLNLRVWTSGNKVAITSFPDFVLTQTFDAATPIGLKEAFLVRNVNLFGIVGEDRNLILPIDNQNVNFYKGIKDGYFVIRKNGNFGLTDSRGKILVPATLEAIIPCSNGHLVFSKNQKWGLKAGAETELVEPIFDSIVAPNKEQELFDFPLVGYRKGKCKLIGPKGDFLTDFEKCSWIYLKENVWAKVQSNEYALFNSQAKAQGNLKFQEILEFSEGNAPVKLDGKWGFINLFGRVVIPNQFEEVLPYKSGIAYARQNGKWGVLKRNGTWLVKPIGKGVSIDKTGKRTLETL